MRNSTDLKPALDFLSRLQENNDRAWFNENRAEYEDAKARFEDLVDRIIDGLRPIEDLDDLRAQDCVMRIYRDVRFSKDKSPYRTNMAASIARGGKRSPRAPYYFHLEPRDGSFVAGGMYMPSSEQLNAFRAAIARDARPFKAIVAGERFRHYFGTIEGEQLKTAPQGYAKDHPEIELLRYKQVLAMHRLPDEVVLADGLVDHVVQAFAALKPLLDYLNET